MHNPSVRISVYKKLKGLISEHSRGIVDSDLYSDQQRFLPMKTKTSKDLLSETSSKKFKLFTEIIIYSFFLLFLYAATSKLFDFHNFKIQLSKSPILTNFAVVLVWLVPAIEISTAIMLLFSRTLLIGLYFSFGLMTLFTAYIIAILKFTDSIPCSCGGILQSMSWNQHLVFNAVFIMLAFIGIILQDLLNKNKAKT